MDLTKKSFLRDVLGGYMIELGLADDSVVIVNADLMGTCRNRSFVEAFPERSFNVGIAEQNMISFAAGLAHEGFKAYTFSMAPFISMRACEQVRTDVAYANINVRMLAPYSGVSGGISGATHWGIEDCAIMSAMPNMVVMEPSDATQAKEMLKASLHYDGPIYIRSSVEPVPDIYDNNCLFEIGKASIPVEGDEGAFICSGITVKYAIEAAKRLKEQFNRNVRVIDMHTIKPIDREAVKEAAKTGRIVVAQDHNIVGGLGQMVSSVIAEEGLAVKFRNVGIRDAFVAMAHAPYLYRQFGYDADGLFSTMMQLFGG